MQTVILEWTPDSQQHNYHITGDSACKLSIPTDAKFSGILLGLDCENYEGGMVIGCLSKTSGQMTDKVDGKNSRRELLPGSSASWRWVKHPGETWYLNVQGAGPGVKVTVNISK